MSFTDEEVELADLTSLSEQDLRDLLPTAGARAKFRSALQNMSDSDKSSTAPPSVQATAVSADGNGPDHETLSAGENKCEQQLPPASAPSSLHKAFSHLLSRTLSDLKCRPEEYSLIEDETGTFYVRYHLCKKDVACGDFGKCLTNLKAHVKRSVHSGNLKARQDKELAEKNGRDVY